MALRKKPDAMKDKVNELWDEMISINGEGLVAIVRANRDDIGKIKEDVAFVKGKLDGHTGATPPTRKQIIIRKLVESAIGMAIIGGLFLVGALIFAGKLDADGIADILRAWKGAP